MLRTLIGRLFEVDYIILHLLLHDKTAVIWVAKANWLRKPYNWGSSLKDSNGNPINCSTWLYGTNDNYVYTVASCLYLFQTHPVCLSLSLHSLSLCSLKMSVHGPAPGLVLAWITLPCLALSNAWQCPLQHRAGRVERGTRQRGRGNYSDTQLRADSDPNMSTNCLDD